MFCWKCGAENTETAKFCLRCGADLTGPGPSGGKNRWLWISLVILAVVILMAAVAIVIWALRPVPLVTPDPTSVFPTNTSSATVEASDGSEPEEMATASPTVWMPVLPEELGTSNLYLEYILDASGSMNEALPDGSIKLRLARDLLREHLQAFRPETNIGLRAYGHRVYYQQTAESCQDIELIAPVQPGQLETIVTWLGEFQAQGMTPLAESIRVALEDFFFEPARINSIVMLSDGIETCEGDPCGLVKELKAEGVNFTIHVIGLDVDEPTREQLQCIARESGGTYHDARSAKDLEAVLGAIQHEVAQGEVLVPHGQDTPTPVLPTDTPTPVPPTDTPSPLPPSDTPAPSATPTRTRSPRPTATRFVTSTPLPAGAGRIVFVSHRDSNLGELYLMDGDGRNQRRLTNTPGIEEWHPHWSPDGTRIVFQCYRSGGPGFNVCLINADGSGYTEITNWEQGGSGAQRPVWSPDGSQIAVSREMGDGSTWIWVMNADGTNQRQLVEGRDPSWSPDGTRIAFHGQVNGQSGQLVTVSLDGSNLRQLTDLNDFIMYPTWSPDGRQIAFEVGMTYIAVIDADGGEPRTVVNKRSWNLSWSPDGTRLAIAPVGDGIWVVNLDGSGLHQIAQEGTQPSWHR